MFLKPLEGYLKVRLPLSPSSHPPTHTPKNVTPCAKAEYGTLHVCQNFLKKGIKKGKESKEPHPRVSTLIQSASLSTLPRENQFLPLRPPNGEASSSLSFFLALFFLQLLFLTTIQYFNICFGVPKKLLPPKKIPKSTKLFWDVNLFWSIVGMVAFGRCCTT